MREGRDARGEHTALAPQAGTVDSGMAIPVDRCVEVLSRTPGTLRAMLGGQSDFWAARNYGEGTFSPLDVVRHLTEADRTNWIPRARHIVEVGEREPFPPFDRTTAGRNDAPATIDGALDEFAAAREASLDALRAMSLRDDDLAARGLHPELGPVTLGQLLATWTAHDLHHTHQIAKAMAFQCRDEVGPWVKFISILR